jgi:plastocyanin
MRHVRPAPPILLLGLFAAAESCAGATTYTVTVGPGQIFSPPSLIIQTGDSVKFRSLGGLHNVKADDNSWRCAFGCDGEGGNGSPSVSLWTFTRVFNQAGTVGYYCETHGTTTSGMRGRVIVQDTTPVTLQEFRVD